MTGPRSCLRCGRAGIAPGTDPGTRVCRECELDRQSGEPPLPSGVDDDRKARVFIEGSGWRLARTMLDVPHQYTVRDLGSPDAGKTTAYGHAAFEWFVRYIRARGVRKEWGPYEHTYLIVDEWEYWTMGYPVEETTIINRQAIGARARETIAGQIAEALGEGP